MPVTIRLSSVKSKGDQRQRADAAAEAPYPLSLVGKSSSVDLAAKHNHQGVDLKCADQPDQKTIKRGLSDDGDSVTVSKRSRTQQTPAQVEDDEDDNISPKGALIPAPAFDAVMEEKIDTLNPILHPKDFLALKKEYQRKYTHIAAKWNRFSPAYRIKGVKLSQLVSRSKNAAKDQAQLKADSMADIKPDAGSMRVFDELGEPLVAVFALRPKSCASEASKPPRQAPYYPGPSGRTLEDLSKDVFYDGMSGDLLQLYHYATQRLLSVQPPRPPKNGSQYETKSVTTHCNQTVTPHAYQHEQCGVGYYLHAGRQHNRKKGCIIHSKDMAGTSNTKQAAVKMYFRSTKQVAWYLDALFKVSFPLYHAKYSEAFKAGVWETEDPGPWTGRAIVWKLQMFMCQNDQDDGPSAIFSCGNFEGGVFYLPDLSLKLQYQPGDVIIFMAGALYYRVGPWVSQPMRSSYSNGLTPGGISTIFFVPNTS